MKKLITLIIILIIHGNTYAVHFRGGEMTWECVTSGPDAGKIIFKLNLYRECSGVALPGSATINNPLASTFGGPSSITCTRVSVVDLSPECDTSGIFCSSTSSLGSYAYEKNVYESLPTQINGVPSTSGSAFWYSSCCRPSNIVNTNSGGSFYLRAVMYPYLDPNTGQTASLGTTSGASCYDSGPTFIEDAPYLMSQKKLNFYTLKSVDPECDSLHYENTAPRQTASSLVSYNTGFSVTAPFGTNISNTPFSLDGDEGTASFKTYDKAGIYNLAGKVSTYKYGQKVGEVYRDLVILIDSTLLTGPSLTNTAPNITFKNAVDPTYVTEYHDTVDVKDSVHINIRAIDGGFLSPGNLQSVRLYIIPDAAYASYDNGYSCQFAECAYIDTNTSVWQGTYFEGLASATVDFKWKVDCEHLYKCQNSQFQDGRYQNYTFSVVARDNQCLLPMKRIASFTITVQDTASAQSKIKSIFNVDSTSTITWKKYSAASFSKYNIYALDTFVYPYSRIDSLTNINDTSYTYTFHMANRKFVKYKITAFDNPSCASEENSASALLLNIKKDTTTELRRLEWNSMTYGRNLCSNGIYLVQGDTAGAWFTIDTLMTNGININYWTDNTLKCIPWAKFRIRAFDNDEGIEYLSNADSLWHYDTLVSQNVRICQGDSIFLAGAYRNSSGTYREVLTNSISCNYVDQYILTVDPVYEVSLPDEEICFGDSLKIGNTYYSEPGTYGVLYSSVMGCDSVVNTKLAVNKVNTDININSPSQLEADATSSTYQWIDCQTNAIIPGETNKTFSPPGNGRYKVAVRTGVCEDTSKCIKLDYVGIMGIGSSEFNIYPNPTSGKIFLSSTKNIDVVNIHDYTGKFLISREINTESACFDLSEYPDGMYLVEILFSDGLSSRKRVLLSR